MLLMMLLMMMMMMMMTMMMMMCFSHPKGWQDLRYPPVKVDSTALMVYDKPLVESGAIYLDTVVVDFPSLRAILAPEEFR